jgi:hypothetical protein
MSALRRLLLLLLPLVLALGPMSVAPTAAHPAGHAVHGMDMSHHPMPQLPDHHANALCLGCVAPATLGTPVLMSPPQVPPSLAALPLPVLVPPMAPQPATPPPRLG